MSECDKFYRFGPVKKPEAVFGTEQRFQWQNSKYAADVAYDLPDVKMTRSGAFYLDN